MLRMSWAAVVLLQIFAIGRAEAQPSVFWFNDPVGPDETVIVTGAGLEAVTGIAISRVADDSSQAEPTVPRNVELLQQNPQSLKFVVPKEFAAGIYRFTLTFPEGKMSARLNLPTVYWTQTERGDTVSPGGTVQVFGRNIVRRMNLAKLILVPEATGRPVTVPADGGNLWRGSFRVPETLPSGDYRLRISNGEGADDEFADAGRIRVAAPVQARASFNVRDYGAIGDGVVNNSPAIKAAIEAAQQAGGGTVYLPRGRYVVTGTLSLPAGVSLKGERTDIVNLVWQDAENPPEPLIAGVTNFSIEDLTIYASRHGPIVTGGLMKDMPLPNASDIAIRRVRIRASAFRGHLTALQTYQRMFYLDQHYGQYLDTIRLSGNRLTVSDCDLVGSGRALFLLKATNAIVSGNVLNNGRFGWYSVTGSNRVIFERNFVSAGDLQGTGGSINNLWPDVTGSENVIFDHNNFKAMYGWDREALGTDGGGGFYFGPAASLAQDRLSLTGPANEQVIATTWVGAVVMVADGKGAGQSARVLKFDPAGADAPMSVTLDRKLAVDLDATSVITVTQMHRNYLIVDNTFEDTGVAALFYGTGLNHVLAGNVSVRTGGFFSRGMFYHHFQPSWQIQMLNNRITEGNAYQAGPDRTIASGEALIAVQSVRPQGYLKQPPLVRAMIVRGNRMDDDSHIEITGESPTFPGVRDVVVEDNVIAASRLGLVIDRGVLLSIERRNTVNRLPR